jgi:hypothetical protein
VGVRFVALSAAPRSPNVIIARPMQKRREYTAAILASEIYG